MTSSDKGASDKGSFDTIVSDKGSFDKGASDKGAFDNFFNMWEPVQTLFGFPRAEIKFVGDSESVRSASIADLQRFQQRKEQLLLQAPQNAYQGGSGGSGNEPPGRGGYESPGGGSDGSGNGSPEGDPLHGIRVTDYADLDLVVRDYGIGGMCFVVWGPNRTTGGWCAAKIPHEALVARSEGMGNDLRARFEQEALHWCELWPHPFIVVPAGLTRIPRWRDLPALVLEYCPGGSLREKLAQAHLTRQPLSPHEAFRWAQQVALGLSEMHQPWNSAQQPLIHCDLKPGNIVIDAHGTARITDLGLARVWAALPPEAAKKQARETLATVLDTFSTSAHADLNEESFSTVIGQLTDATEVSSDGTAAGTPPYMSLEQWRGLNAVTTASDVYALGIVIFEIFAGMPGTPHHPAPGFTHPLLAWYRAHQNGPRHTLASTYGDPATACGPLSAMLAHRGTGPHAATDVVRAQRVLKGLDDLVLACVQDVPSNRPTAGQVAEALASLAEELECERVQVPQVFRYIPANVAIYYQRLAAIYGQLGNRGKQHELMRLAVERNPDDAGLEYGFGKAIAEQEKYEEAIKHFNQAENLINAQQIAWATSITYMLPFSKGNAYLKLGRYGDALAAYETSLGIMPENAGTLFMMAYAYYLWAPHAIHDTAMYRERLKRGLHCASEALRHDPAFPRASELRDELAKALAQVAGR